MADAAKEPRLRIIQGRARELEVDLNELLDRYAVLNWNFAVVGGEVMITAILLAQSEIRKQALTAQPVPFRLPVGPGGRGQ